MIPVNYPRILIIVQARRGSSRLPDKIMLPVLGKPMLIRMIERVNSSKVNKKVIVATTELNEDDKVVDLCKQNRVEYFRGHPDDLLDRHYKAGLAFAADVIVKIPSDCPLVCPYVIDRVINFYVNNKSEFDFVSNLHPASYPDGNDVEVIPMNILETAWKEANKSFQREHATPFIWESPERFRIGNDKWETGLDFSMSHKFSLDYVEDYEFIKRIYEELYHKKNIFSLTDILMLLERKPEIKKINQMYAGVNWYGKHLGELKTISAEQTRIVS